MSFSVHDSPVYNGVSLSQSRVATIKNADTLDDAQRMGLFDRIVDYFRGGVKKEAIRQAFNDLRAPLDDKHENVLLAFDTFRRALKADKSDLGKLFVEVNESNQTWSYAVTVEGKAMAMAEGLPVRNGQTLAAFQDYQMLSTVGDLLNAEYGADSADVVRELFDQFAEINGRFRHGDGPFGVPAQCEKLVLLAQHLERMGASAPHRFIARLDIDADLSSARFLVGKNGRSEFPIARFPIRSWDDLALTLTAMAAAEAASVNRTVSAEDSAQATIETMVDGKSEQQSLRGKLSDPLFSHDHFVSVEVLADDPSKFAARFKDGQTGREKTLEFSNRPPTRGEFRGERLRDDLATRKYANLSELIEGNIGTPEDSMLLAALPPIRAAINEILDTVNDPSSVGYPGSDAPEDRQAWSQRVMAESIAPIAVGKTTLGDLLAIAPLAKASLPSSGTPLILPSLVANKA